MTSNTQRWPAIGTIAGLVVAAGVFLFLVGVDLSGADRAYADQAPADCSSNALGLEFARIPSTVQQGDIIEYRILVKNNSGADPAACDITGADIGFVEPAADGTATGAKHSLAIDESLPADGSGDLCFRSSTAPVALACPAGTSLVEDNSLSYVVNVDTGVTSAAAGSSITGDRDPSPGCLNGAATLHDSEPESDACAAKTLSTAVEEEEETPTPTPSPSPTALAATDTPQALPVTGGAPGGGFDWPVGLLIILAAVGVGFALAGRAAMVASRRRIE